MTYTYIFGSLKTGEVLYEIPCRGVDINAGLNGGGDLRASFSLDMKGYSNQSMLDATIPGLCFVIVELNGIVIWDGFITSRWYQSQAKVIQIYAKHISAYPDMVEIDSNFIRSNIEQSSIFIDLWNIMQSDPNRNIGVVVPSPTVDLQLKSCEIYPYDHKTFLSAMQDMSSGLFGFDWTVGTVKVGSAYVRTLRFGYPHLSPISRAANLIFEYPGAITNYYATESDVATRVTGLGNGSKADMITASVTFSDIENVGIRMDTTTSFKEVSDTTTLEDLTNQYALAHKPPGLVISIEVHADSTPVFGSYDIGSAATVIIKDSRFPSGINYPSWVVAWNLKPASSDNIGIVRITFAEDVSG